MTDSRHHLGDVVGGYVLERRLGTGASSTVYLARDTNGTLVALKLLAREVNLGERNRGEFSGKQRLQSEAVALSKLDMPGIAHVLDLEVEANEEAFLVTEYIPGFTLEEDVLRGGAWNCADVLELGQLLADTLTAVHARGVCHRDIKPANVILGPSGPVLIDFGIAFACGSPRLTQTGLVVGTPGFISPEVINGKTPEFQDDWWSLGSTLLFSLTGRLPFGTGSQAVQIARIVAGNPDVENLDGDLASVFVRFLAPLESRSADLTDVFAALDCSNLPLGKTSERGENRNWEFPAAPTLALSTADVEGEALEPVVSFTDSLDQPLPDSSVADGTKVDEPAGRAAEPVNKPAAKMMPFFSFSTVLLWAAWAPAEEIVAWIVLAAAVVFFATAGWYSRVKRKILSTPTVLVKGLLSAVPALLVVAVFLLGSRGIGMELVQAYMAKYCVQLNLFGTMIPLERLGREIAALFGAILAWCLPYSAPARFGARSILYRLLPQWWLRLLLGVLLVTLSIPPLLVA